MSDSEINREQVPNVRSNTEKEQKPCVLHIITALLDLEYVRISQSLNQKMSEEWDGV